MKLNLALMRMIIIGLLMLVSQLVKSQQFAAFVLSDTSAIVQKVLKDSVKYRLQIIYSEITENKSFLNRNQLSLQTDFIRQKPDEYFFPASLVKMPVAALALEKINELSIYGINQYSPFAPLSDFECTNRKDQPAAYTVHELVDKIFVYSDNHAFNYLYELCGQAFINTRLSQMGYSNARIVEKIARCNEFQNDQTGPIVFYDNQKTIHIEGRQLPVALNHSNIDTKIGKGYLWNGKYVASAKDFAGSNVVPLEDFHKMLVTIVMPEQVKESERFRLSEAQRNTLMESMSTLPGAYCPDSCNNQTYKDTHVKYMMGFRDSIPSEWKVYNKVGLAHGFISDCTYFEDKKNGIRFFLSAVIYVNEDNILNDGKYEYYTIGFPYMKALGRLAYQYELNKKQRRN